MKNIYVVLGTIVVVVGVGLAAAHQAFFREFGEQNEALRKIVNQKHRQNVELSRLRQRLTDLEKSDQQAVQDLNVVKQRIPEQSNLLELFNDLQYQVLKSGMTLDRMTTPPPAPHEPGKLFRQPLTIEVSYRRSPGHDEAGKAQMM
ncbi:MAG TPA: type 4a pilus biogenesis protein PilO, partial [Acidobacteriota bacterium]|nr:type 4a pilus biogenesis protein PilO [Acidobacteriota bacterium]